MAQASEKKTISQNHSEQDLPASAQNIAPEELEPQVLVLTTEEETQVESGSSSLSNKLMKLFNNLKYNARISEEKICVRKIKGQVDTNLLGVRNFGINF